MSCACVCLCVIEYAMLYGVLLLTVCACVGSQKTHVFERVVWGVKNDVVGGLMCALLWVCGLGV